MIVSSSAQIETKQPNIDLDLKMGVAKQPTLLILLLMSASMPSSESSCDPKQTHYWSLCELNYTYIRKINKCLRISDEEGSWLVELEGQPPCIGGHYVKIGSEYENKIIIDFIKGIDKHENHRLFIGLHENDKGKFTWMSDNTSFDIKWDFNAFNLKSFQQRRASHKCGFLDPKENYTWRLVECHMPGKGLCEAPPFSISSTPSLELINQSDRYLVVGERITVRCTATLFLRGKLEFFYYLENENRLEPVDADGKETTLKDEKSFTYNARQKFCWVHARQELKTIVRNDMLNKTLACLSETRPGILPCSGFDPWCTKLASEVVQKRPGRPEKPEETDHEIDLEKIICLQCWLKELWKVLRYIWGIFFLLLLLILLLYILCSPKKQGVVASEEDSSQTELPRVKSLEKFSEVDPARRLKEGDRLARDTKKSVPIAEVEEAHPADSFKSKLARPSEIHSPTSEKAVRVSKKQQGVSRASRVDAAMFLPSETDSEASLKSYRSVASSGTKKSKKVSKLP